MEKKKICLVVQRYGLEINGGAEQHCRMLAERMLPFYDVEVLTTKAVDYMTWADEYTEDLEVLNGVKVRRFSVVKTRDKETFDEVNYRFHNNMLKRSEEQEWMDKQGPYVPNMISYIREHKNDYEAFLFFTYLYYPTAMGIKEVHDKAIVFSLAHDEPYLQMKIFDDVFLKPRAFFFNTEEERRLVRRKYRNYSVPYMIGGVGVDIPEHVDGEAFKKKYGLDNYIVYVGRIDEGKNCSEMFEYFERYKKSHPGDVKLVLMGKAVIPVPKRKDIVELGFVSDEDKFNGMAGAEFLILPSKFESLSMVVLESFGVKTPVLVNGECEVLKAHCRKSHGGYYYTSYNDFEIKVGKLLSDNDLRKKMGQRGAIYLKKNYQWDLICRKLLYLIESITENNA
ncbi:MAG: glycosyltransferase [Clostridiales bacterium]|nr:glycosyltransferase [Clostridiales bacterium]MBS5878350.1 glycosyltransferase [Clostridiales bacterium]